MMFLLQPNHCSIFVFVCGGLFCGRCARMPGGPGGDYGTKEQSRQHESRPCQKTGARVRPGELADNKRASQPTTNARVSRQQTRESGQKKNDPRVSRPKTTKRGRVTHPKTTKRGRATLVTQRLSARWPVGPLAFYLGSVFHRIRNPDSGGSGTRIRERSNLNK